MENKIRKFFIKFFLDFFYIFSRSPREDANTNHSHFDSHLLIILIRACKHESLSFALPFANTNRYHSHSQMQMRITCKYESLSFRFASKIVGMVIARSLIRIPPIWELISSAKLPALRQCTNHTRKSTKNLFLKIYWQPYDQYVIEQNSCQLLKMAYSILISESQFLFQNNFLATSVPPVYWYSCKVLILKDCLYTGFSGHTLCHGIATL